MELLLVHANLGCRIGDTSRPICGLFYADDIVLLASSDFKETSLATIIIYCFCLTYFAHFPVGLMSTEYKTTTILDVSTD